MLIHGFAVLQLEEEVSMREQTFVEKEDYKRMLEELREAHEDATQASEVS